MFKKILIANRGEIAVRVARACREMGIATVAVYSDADRASLHVIRADEAVHIGAAPSRESYLRIDRILEAGLRAGAEAIHPGYGFLAENPGFARSCGEAGMVFIGPPPQAMELMGSKTAARQAVRAAGMAVVPGTDHDVESLEEIRRAAQAMGFPVIVKAAAGGGGMGMRVVASEGELESACRNARSEAQNAFNDPSIYVEKYVERPRHVEIQIIGDEEGHLIFLGERECSLQRRHRKVIEECPSPFLDESLRQAMGAAAVRIGKLADYSNAGTVEFLVDRNRNFYFLEMNTRLQVEHPVTEMVTGLDLVKTQIRIAAGEKLEWTQDQIKMRGWAMECRVSAEDPGNNFFPSPGLVAAFEAPAGPGVRDDSGIYEGWTVPLEYDSLLSKLIVWAEDRPRAIARMRRALEEYRVSGPKTNLDFLRRIMDHPGFMAGDLDTLFIDRALAEGLLDTSPDPGAERIAVLAAALHYWRQEGAGEPAGAAPAPSAWKSAGREDLLNHWPDRQARAAGKAK